MNKKQYHKVLTLNDDRPLRIKPCVVTTVPTGVWRYTFIDRPRNRSHREIFLYLSATLVPTRTYIISCKLFERRSQVRKKHRTFDVCGICFFVEATLFNHFNQTIQTHTLKNVYCFDISKNYLICYNCYYKYIKIQNLFVCSVQ